MLQLLHTCAIARNQAGSATNGRRQLTTLSLAAPCLMLPSGGASSVSNRYDVGKAADFYFDVNRDVQAGDVLTYDGATYTVKGVETYNVPHVGHKHALAQRESV